MNTILLEKVKIQTCSASTGLSSFFQIKNYNKKVHEHDIVYQFNFPEDLQDYQNPLKIKTAEIINQMFLNIT